MFFDFTPLLTAIEPAPPQRHHWVKVKHRRSDGNNDNNILHIDKVLPATQQLVKLTDFFISHDAHEITEIVSFVLQEHI